MFESNTRAAIILLLILNMGIVMSLQEELYKQQDSDKIYQFENNEINDFTNSWNRTYVFNGSLISDPQITNIYLELEIKTPLHSSNQIIFSVNKDTFIAQYIDTRGYLLHKQHYRIEIQLDDDMKQSDQYYITIYQNTPNPQELQYSLSMKVLNQNQEKLCPFNCLDRGICNVQYGTCECNSNYIDYDCSKQSSDLISLSTQQNQLDNLKWNLQFENHDDGLFFHIKDNHFDGFLYLQISLDEEFQTYQNIDQNQTLNVFYTLETKRLQQIGVADGQYSKRSYTIKLSQLLQNRKGFEVLLDHFSNGSNKNYLKDQLNQNQIDFQQIILLGFRLSQDNKSNQLQKLKFNAQLVNKDQATPNQEIQDQTSIVAFSLQLNEIIAILILIIFILIAILVGLLVYTRYRYLTIFQSDKYQQSQLLKYLKKQEEELNKYYNLIPQFIFNQINKQQYWPKLKNTTETDSETPTCSICLCEFTEGEEIRMTYCTHFFHSECLKGWVKQQKNCPNCRSDMSQDKIQSLKSSPQQIKKQIVTLKNDSPISNLRQNNGYEQQIDEIVIQIEPIQSELITQKHSEQQGLQQQISV